MDTKFKTVFAGQMRAIQPTEETQNEVKASLVELKGLLPKDINPEEEPALLFVAGNLAVADMINLNDDGLDKPTALAVYKKFARQQINLEHDRKSVVGYIVHAGLSEFGTDRLLTDEEAAASEKPFNIAVVIALWRAVNSDLCNYIEQVTNPLNPDAQALSLSFEMGFDDYRIIALPTGEKEISKASVTYTTESGDFERITNSLRAYSGSGLHPDDKSLRLYRIIDKGVIPLGGGIVTVPAAFVKGIVAITEKPQEITTEVQTEVENTEIEDESFENDNEEMAASLQNAKTIIIDFISNADKKSHNSLKINKICVSSFTSNILSNMKSTDIQALKERATKATKVEELTEVVASATSIIDAIVAESERQETARKEAESHTAKIEAAKQEAQAAAEKLAQDLATVKAELQAIKEAQAAAAAEQAFNERMSAVDATFDLTDDEKSEIVADIRGLDDEAFAKWMTKSKKLMKEKTKEHKQKMADEMKASQEALLAKLNEKGVKAKFNETALDIEEVIASAKENVVSAPAGTIVKPETNDLTELAKKAMSGLTFGGSNK